MITRATKHIFRACLREGTESNVANVVAHLLNCLIGRSTKAQQPLRKLTATSITSSPLTATSKTLYEEIVKEVKTRFQYDLPASPESLRSLLSSSLTLRSICQKVGIQILAREYDFTTDSPFQPDDILDLFPIVKHINPEVHPKKKILISLN